MFDMLCWASRAANLVPVGRSSFLFHPTHRPRSPSACEGWAVHLQRGRAVGVGRGRAHGSYGAVDNNSTPALTGLVARPIAARAALAVAPAASTGAAAHLLEAVAAVHRLVAARLEREERFLAALRTDGRIHLALTAASTIAVPAPLRGLVRGAALWATAGLVGQAPTGVEILLASCEHEVTATITALQGKIVGHSHTTSLPVPSALARLGQAGSHDARAHPKWGNNVAEGHRGSVGQAEPTYIP